MFNAARLRSGDGNAKNLIKHREVCKRRRRRKEKGVEGKVGGYRGRREGGGEGGKGMEGGRGWGGKESGWTRGPVWFRPFTLVCELQEVNEHTLPRFSL